MCMYSVFAEDGVPTDWHLVHLGSRAVGGAGLIIVEATGIKPARPDHAHDLGLWNDTQAEAFEPIVHFLKEHGSVPAVQLAHAGRKAGVPGAIGPSPLAFSPDYSVPLEMALADIGQVMDAFRSAAQRACRPASRPSKSTRPTATCCTSSSHPSATGARTSTAAASRTARGCTWRW